MKTDFATGRKPEADEMQKELLSPIGNERARFHTAKRDTGRLFLQSIPPDWISDLYAHSPIGLFCVLRTPHDSNGPSWAAWKRTSLASNTVQCVNPRFIGGDQPAVQAG